MLAHSLALTRQPQAAEDLAQQTWLGLLSVITTYSGRASLGTWLLRLTRNTFLAQLRHQRVSPLSLDALAAAGHAPSAPDPALAALTSRLDLDYRLAELSPDERQAVLLHDWLGLPYGEAARIMRRPPGTAKALRCQACRKSPSSPELAA
ncbi:MAG: RNA polymerase sigma factor [Terriglobales bacterium]